MSGSIVCSRDDAHYTLEALFMLTVVELEWSSGWGGGTYCFKGLYVLNKSVVKGYCKCEYCGDTLSDLDAR